MFSTLIKAALLSFLIVIAFDAHKKFHPVNYWDVDGT